MNLYNMLGFSAPLMCQVAHPARDTAEEPVSSLMKKIRIETARTASINHTCQARFQVSKDIVQRSQTYGVFTEVYNTSARQRELCEEVTYSVKTLPHSLTHRVGGCATVGHLTSGTL